MKNIAKKTLALVLALCLCLSLGATALAAEVPELDVGEMELTVKAIQRTVAGKYEMNYTVKLYPSVEVAEAATVLTDEQVHKFVATCTLKDDVTAKLDEDDVADIWANTTLTSDVFEIKDVAVENGAVVIYVGVKDSYEQPEEAAEVKAAFSKVIELSAKWGGLTLDDAKAYDESNIEATAVYTGTMYTINETAELTDEYKIVDAARPTPAGGGVEDTTDTTDTTDETETTPVTEVFNDVENLSEDEMAAVQFVYDAKLMEGYPDGTFGPEDNDTRAMFATVLFRLLGQEGDSTDASFDDVDPNEWYGKAVAWAAANGYVLGYGDGTFGVDDNITREQIITILWRAFGSPEAEAAEGASDWAAVAMGWAIEMGIIDAEVDPTADATRLEMAEYVTAYALNVVALAIVEAAAEAE